MFQKQKRIFLFLTSMLVASISIAQPTVHSRISTGEITIGDPIRVFFDVIPQSKNDQILWPSFQDSIPGLDWIEIGKIDTIQSKDSLLYRQQVSLTGFDSGNFIIPSFSFQFQADNKKITTLHTDSFRIHVQTIAVDTSQPIKPIQDIMDVPASWFDYWKLIVGIIVLIGLIVLVYFYFKNRKRKPREIQKVPPEKAHEKAMRLLKDLKEKQLWQKGLIKEYYAQLSDIIRNYLDDRFEIKAMELTTDELLKTIKKDKQLKSIRPELKRILRTADLAKYAKAHPLAEEQEACMEAALLMIQKTKMKEGEVSQK